MFSKKFTFVQWPLIIIIACGINFCYCVPSETEAEVEFPSLKQRFDQYLIYLERYHEETLRHEHEMNPLFYFYEPHKDFKNIPDEFKDVAVRGLGTEYDPEHISNWFQFIIQYMFEYYLQHYVKVKYYIVYTVPIKIPTPVAYSILIVIFKDLPKSQHKARAKMAENFQMLFNFDVERYTSLYVQGIEGGPVINTQNLSQEEKFRFVLSYRLGVQNSEEGPPGPSSEKKAKIFQNFEKYSWIAQHPNEVLVPIPRFPRPSS